MTKKVIEKFCLERIDLFSKILSGKVGIFWKFAWKIENFFTQIHDLKISNQIDAAAFGILMV